MKNVVEDLVNDSIKELNLFVDDAFIDESEGIKNLNIVLDSSEAIDLEKITEASKIINPIIDETTLIEEDFDVLDIYSKEKGEE